MNAFDTTGFETTATTTPPAPQTTPHFVANTQLADTPPTAHFTANPPDRNTFDPLPLDTYKCSVDKLEVQLDKYGRWEIFAQFKIEDGPFSRRRIFKHCKLNGTKNDAAMQWAALRFLANISPASVGDKFPPNLPQINATVENVYAATSGKYYAVRLTQSGKYTNVDVVGVYKCP